MTNWHPIETAPKDGASVLLLFEDGEMSVAYYDAYYEQGNSGYDGRSDYAGISAWIEPCSGEQIYLHYGTPTHWMPLPEPPK